MIIILIKTLPHAYMGLTNSPSVSLIQTVTTTGLTVISDVPEDSEKLTIKHSCSDSSILSSIIGIDIHCLVAVDVNSTEPDCSRKSSGAANEVHDQ